MSRLPTPIVGGRDGSGERETGERSEALVVSAEHSPSEGPIIIVDGDKPWGTWPMPTEYKVDAIATRAAAIQGPVDGARRLAFVGPDGLLGFPTRGALKDLSTQIKFPLEYVEKMSLDMQADVLNWMLGEVKDSRSHMTATVQPFQIETDAGVQNVDGVSAITNMAPGWRDILPHSWVAQKSYDIMTSVYKGDNGVTIQSAKLTEAGCEIRYKTNYSQEVRPGGRNVGDVLSLGILVTHKYGIILSAALYVERLACRNGMTATRNEFEWKAAIGADQRGQLDWLGSGIAAAASAFESLIVRCREMADTSLGADPERAVIERARAMGVRPNAIPRVLAAYRMEEDPTEWGALNAATRYATHDENVSEDRRRRLWDVAGNWANTFDMVSARLPRPLAVAVGASIFGDSAE